MQADPCAQEQVCLAFPDGHEGGAGAGHCWENMSHEAAGTHQEMCYGHRGEHQ